MVASIGVAVAAQPAIAAQDQRLENLAATDLFALAGQARAEGRMEEAAALYEALEQDPDAEVRAEARFRRGMMLADAKRYAQAAVAFRALLDEKPDATRVRLELARVLAALGDETAARRALRQAQASGLPDDVAVTVEQYARALRSTRRFGGSVEVAVAPDSNINRATQARTLDTIIAPLTLSRDARARSGVGLKLSGQAYARLPLTETLSLVPRIAGVGMLYRVQEVNDVSGSALLGLEWRSGKDRISPSVGETWRWFGGDPYARTETATLDWLHPIGTRAQLSVHGGAARVRYRRNPLQDGALFDMSVGIERAVTSRSGFGLTLSGYRQTAEDPGYAAISGGATAITWWDVGRTTLFTSAGLSRLQGDERLFLFPSRRREWLVRASAGATLRQLTFRGFAPVVRVSAERNHSTVGLYDYRRIAVELGINRAF